MESSAFEEKVARLAARRCDDQALPTPPDTAFDVAEVLLENLDCQADGVAEIVEVDLNTEELAALQASAAHVRETVEKWETLPKTVLF